MDLSDLDLTRLDKAAPGNVQRQIVFVDFIWCLGAAKSQFTSGLPQIVSAITIPLSISL